MEVILTIISALLGASIGSFINVCVDRLPNGKSLLYPPSHCDACQHPLSPLDLVPVFSYLWLRGRCRYCRASVPRRVLWVEIGTAMLFALVFQRYGLSPMFAVAAIYSSLFVALGLIDLQYKLILNKITYPSAIVTLLVLSTDSLLPDLRLFDNLIFLPAPRIISGLIGGVVAFAFFLLVIRIYPKGMGWGDVKMAGLIGLVTGFPLVFVALFIGIFIGGIVAIVLLVFKIRGRKAEIPYGAFLAIGPIATLLWGNQILHWYLGLF